MVGMGLMPMSALITRFRKPPIFLLVRRVHWTWPQGPGEGQVLDEDSAREEPREAEIREGGIEPCIALADIGV